MVTLIIVMGVLASLGFIWALCISKRPRRGR
jgi:hypothetical protein